MQKSRFRNAKAQLPLFNKIIFTKAKLFFGKILKQNKENQSIENINFSFLSQFSCSQQSYKC